MSSLSIFLTFVISTYIIYIVLLTFSFIKINKRIKHILYDYKLTEVLYHKYTVLTIIIGPISFFALLSLTFLPIIHFTGYFFIFVFITEYTEKKILNIIIDKEVKTFRKEMQENNLHNLFTNNIRCHMLEHKINSICDYFSTNSCYDNLFIFYQFLSLKTSIHNVLEMLKEKNAEEVNMLDYNQQAAIKIDKAINSTFAIMRKHEVPYDGIS